MISFNELQELRPGYSGRGFSIEDVQDIAIITPAVLE
jgi:hypothetical protein